MPIISKKGQEMPQSPIRKLVPFAEKAKQNGTKVFHLNIGQPDIKTPDVALNAIKENTIDVLAYGRSEGSDSYREKLANYYAKHNVNITKDNIVVTTGGSEALLFAMGALMDAGDQVIIPEPFYANYNGFSISSGVKIVPVNSTIDTGFALPPITDFEELITDKTKAILICNPGNPSGYLYSKDEMKELATLVKKHDLFLIADEVYREFIYDEDVKHQSVLSDFGLDEHGIIIDSVSKRYSMCGARVGCLVSKNKAVIEAVLKFAQARLCPPTYAVLASEAALDTPDSYFEEVINEYKNRRETLINGLQSIEGVTVSKPKGAFYCVAELPVKDADDFAQWLLSDFSLNGETIMVAPASGFYSTEGLGKNQVRIAYVLKNEDLKSAVNILKAAIQAYNNK
ncbi:pyridoxal phosphate-dependent aminotransferase [Urechidicola sp. KH5]